MHRLILLGALALFIGGLLAAAWPSTAAAVDPVNVVENGGFEAGEPFAGWTVVTWPGGAGTWCPQTGTSAPGISFGKGPVCGGKGGSLATVEAPPEGDTAAMTNQDGPSSAVLYQCVEIPADAVSAEISFQVYLLNDFEEWITDPSLDPGSGKPGPLGLRFPIGNGIAGPNQQFRADVVSATGMGGDPFTVAGSDVLMNVYQTDPGDPLESGYDLVSADVSALAGQSVCVRFAEVDNQSYLNAGVDDVKLMVQGPEEPTPTETPPSAAGGVDVTVSDDSPAPSDTVEVTATATDADGNPIEGAECTFRIYTQPGDDASVEAGPVTTDASGQATATLDVGSTVGTVEVLAQCGAFAEVLAVDVGVSLPPTGAGGGSSDTSNWLLLAAGLAALGLGALSLRMRRA